MKKEKKELESWKQTQFCMYKRLFFLRISRWDTKSSTFKTKTNENYQLLRIPTRENGEIFHNTGRRECEIIIKKIESPVDVNTGSSKASNKLNKIKHFPPKKEEKKKLPDILKKKIWWKLKICPRQNFAYLLKIGGKECKKKCFSKRKLE